MSAAHITLSQATERFRLTCWAIQAAAWWRFAASWRSWAALSCGPLVASGQNA